MGTTNSMPEFVGSEKTHVWLELPNGVQIIVAKTIGDIYDASGDNHIDVSGDTCHVYDPSTGEHYPTFFTPSNYDLDLL